MKVREIMSRDPVCCIADETAQSVASKMCENNVGSIPVVTDLNSKKLTGIVTDRDLCCTIIAQGLDSKSTKIRPFVHNSPVSCRADDDLAGCERAMQQHQIRRIPVVDDQGRCIGIVAQADVALAVDAQQVQKTVAEISRTRPVKG